MSLYISDPFADQVVIRAYRKRHRRPRTTYPRLPAEASGSPSYADFFTPRVAQEPQQLAS
jgi:hypothetical protein